MIGAFFNALGILLGALFGLAWHKPLTARTQAFFKAALGVFTVCYGLRLIYENVHGPIGSCLKQILIAMLGVILGYWVGRLLRLQTWSNRLGRHAGTVITDAQKKPPGHAAAGFVSITVLFCAAPLGLLGTVVDGLESYYYLLLIKAVMDGLAMMGFVRIFRWPVALAALPVFFFFNGLALAVQLVTRLWLEPHGLGGYVGIAAGVITCSVALVIFEVRRVELANYLPGLAIAPLLALWLA